MKGFLRADDSKNIVLELGDLPIIGRYYWLCPGAYYPSILWVD